MKINIKNLFVYSEETEQCSYHVFCNGINIIAGRNTSGKSTLIQSILYTFGINDVSEQLDDILLSNPTFRVDFSNDAGELPEEFSIVRDSNSIYLKLPDGKVESFYGVNGNRSEEHIRLKKFLSDLFGFSLILEKKGTLTEASLETMFLPYYISQSVGWVYLRESFSGLNFYKGFKEDFLDYYLGISNNFDKVKFRELTKEKENLTQEVKNLRKYTEKAEVKFSDFMDERYGEESNEYIVKYNYLFRELDGERKALSKICNDIALLENHKKILIRTKNNIVKQKIILLNKKTIIMINVLRAHRFYHIH